MLRYLTVVLLTSILAAVAGCSSEQLDIAFNKKKPQSNDSLKLDEAEKAPRAVEARSGSAGDDVAIDEPVMVGGSYLVCYKETPLQAGCRVSNYGYKRFFSDDEETEVTIIDILSNLLPIVINDAPEVSPWHWTFTLPNVLDFLSLVRVVVTSLKSGNIEDFETEILGKTFAPILLGRSVRLNAEAGGGEDVYENQFGVNILVPPYISVMEGNAGNHRAVLSINGTECFYQGSSKLQDPESVGDASEIARGSHYFFAGCKGGVMQLGDNVLARSIKLRGDKGPARKTVLAIEIKEVGSSIL